MMRLIVGGLAALHLGPGLAFAMLAFGCDGVPPPLGEMLCGAHPGRLFAAVTLAVWLPAGLWLWRQHRARG
jgi:hypothetical protein